MNGLKIVGIALLALIYLASPIDFVPDVLPIVGWLDDIGVIGWAWSAIKTLNSPPSPEATKDV